MTLVKLSPAEIRLLDIQRARGIPFPDDIFAWRKANAAALAALQPNAVAAGSRHPASRGRAMSTARQDFRRSDAVMTATEPPPLMFRISDVVKLTRLPAASSTSRSGPGGCAPSARQRHPHHRGRARQLRQAPSTAASNRVLSCCDVRVRVILVR